MVLGHFRSFLDRFRLFQIVLCRFSSFLTLVSTLGNVGQYYLVTK